MSLAASFFGSPRPRSLSVRLALVSAGLLLLSCGGQAPVAQPTGTPQWKLTFQEEFDGNQLDTAKWSRRYHWGEAVINSELQAYVDDAFQVSGGMLTIKGEKRQGQYAGKTMAYTSGVICSEHYQTYGRFEMRCRVPAGKGYWPAFWLLAGPSTPNVHEVDIFEILGDKPSVLYTTVHWGTDYGTGHQSAGTSITGPDLSADFHVYSLEWDATKLVWSLDGTEVFRHTGGGVPQVPMYIIANLAIGGGWPGSPDATTVFPGAFQIDYIRAYQLTD